MSELWNELISCPHSLPNLCLQVGEVDKFKLENGNIYAIKGNEKLKSNLNCDTCKRELYTHEYVAYYFGGENELTICKNCIESFDIAIKIKEKEALINDFDEKKVKTVVELMKNLPDPFHRIYPYAIRNLDRS